ncbi:MAG: GtrA family protein [Sphingobacteriaceae bacterium]|nr:GtrA family protein [Sphingobacteriaceae bacterium]
MNYLFSSQLLKFALVGITGMGLDFGTTFLLKERAKINKFIANAAGFSIAVVNNFLLNKYWTFDSVNPIVTEQFVKFVIISIIGLGLNSLLLFILLKKIKGNFYLVKLAVIGLVFFWNFSANYLYTFK